MIQRKGAGASPNRPTADTDARPPSLNSSPARGSAVAAALSPLTIKVPGSGGIGGGSTGPGDERCPRCCWLLAGVLVGCAVTLRFAVPGSGAMAPNESRGTFGALPKHLETARVALGGAPVAPTRPTVVLFGDSIVAKAFDAVRFNSFSFAALHFSLHMASCFLQV